MDLEKDDDGNKIYTNFSDYGNKKKDLESLKQRDFVKIFWFYLSLQYLLMQLNKSLIN